MAGHILAGAGSSPAVGVGRRRNSRLRRRGFGLAAVGSRGLRHGLGPGRRVVGLSGRDYYLEFVF